MSFSSQITNFFLAFDFFGSEVNLYLEGNKKVRTKMSALISFLIIGWAIYLLLTSIFAQQNRENMQILQSTLSLSPHEILTKNESLDFVFEPSNFNMYFSLYSQLPNGTSNNYRELERYFKQTFVYSDKDYHIQDLAFEPCLIREREDYLELDYSDLQGDLNQTSQWTVCVPHKYRMGLYPDVAVANVNQTMISYVIEKCVNTTENKNFCASDQEIQDMIKYVWVQVDMPKTVFDFRNPEKPRKRSFDERFYRLDFDLTKYFTGYLKPVYMKTDLALFSADYELDSIDFNLDTLSYEILLRKEEKTFFQYNLIFGFYREICYRQNQKLYVLLANLGGFANIIILLARSFCRKYNSMNFEHKIMNIAFTNPENREEGKSKYIIL